MNKTINAALQELADVINNLPAAPEPGPEPESAHGDLAREPGVRTGISDRDILNVLLELYKDDPQLVNRLQWNYINNGGNLQDLDK